ncbi:DUF4181 domain-containing protein [Falsibacillus pallidus]|uniref:Uncharacterized protein DUF4181 n=1 Tax=Falsibacillus pallidus TaxID=493781 RepID=A0A370G7R4_9BACI|nr:DUF4181 domain-containing protein [Falsibacillus pallidus]RDI39136.1 uncharacterized protein DUF4181 [Falsibacillus pallidus]
MTFGVKLFLVLLGIFIVMFAINLILRKIFKVEKSNLFSYNHVNGRHKKVDWTIRISVMVLIVIQYAFNAKNDFINTPWYLQTYSLMFVFIVITEVVKAFMEKKYAKNKNQYLVTAYQLLFLCILLGAMFSTHFFGWFDQQMNIPS